MKRIMFSLLSLIALSSLTLPTPTASSTFGVFVATSPCDAVSRPLLKIPRTADCELIKWDLTLHQDLNTLAPNTYKLNYVYGLPQQGTNAVSQGGTKVDRTGKWIIVRGTNRNPNAVVYQLDPDRPQETVSFQMVDDNLLHLLDRDGNLMLGNAGWSYTLSRTGDFGGHIQPVVPHSVSHAKSNSASVLPAAIDPAIVGTFVGRSPCREVARELNRDVNADCFKLKWGLTLYQEPNTHIPTTYKLTGTLYRERIAEGRWTTVKGAKMDPDAVVYQLDPDKDAGSLFFLKADDNILFFLDKGRNLIKGNGDFSYTLNRTSKRLERTRR